MIYLTYNDQPTGVYFSQVTDVCNFVNRKFNADIRLVALISVRNFSANKKSIKQHFSGAIVLPMFPKQKNWKKNKLILKLLFLFIGKQSIWCRGVFAGNLALNLKKRMGVKKIVFDGRGAYKAEYNEYLSKIVEGKNEIAELENNVIHHSDCRIAVSEKLVEYWRNEYDYKMDSHVVIPCTLNNDVEFFFPSKEVIIEIRKELGFDDKDIVFVYSGSSADWQSLVIVDDFIFMQMQMNATIKFMLLANTKLEHLKTYKQFPERIIQKWVKAHEVGDYLSAADYGIVIRENSITNQVASPTKFAEYLNAGLSVLISENIGDFSSFTKQNNCGHIISDFSSDYNFTKLPYSEKVKNFNLAQKYFTKDVFSSGYETILNVLKEEVSDD